MGFGDYEKKGRRFPVEILSSVEVRGLMAVTSRRGLCGTRDRALIATLYRSGLRISEALSLLPKDIDLGTGAVQVLNGKGSKQRVVAVDAETIALLELWLGKRAELGIDGKQPIFCTLDGGAMSDVQVRQHLKALAEKAGIEKRVHPHGLRHSRAVDLVGHGVDVVTISQAFGHSNVSTTNTYLNHVAPAKVIAAMREGTW